MDTRIAAEVTPELTGVRGMLLGEIICANNENRDVYQRDVEQWFHIRRSSVTAILQGMEQDGFITRCSVEKDARLKRLAATPKGVAYHDRIRASIDRFEQDLQQGLTPRRNGRCPRGAEPNPAQRPIHRGRSKTIYPGKEQ